MGIRSWARKFQTFPRLIRYACCSTDKYVRLLDCNWWAATFVFFIGRDQVRPGNAKLFIPSTDPHSYVLCVRYFLAKCSSQGVYGDPGMGEEIFPVITYLLLMLLCIGIGIPLPVPAPMHADPEARCSPKKNRADPGSAKYYTACFLTNVVCVWRLWRCLWMLM
jgi:hypothetical protein